MNTLFMQLKSREDELINIAVGIYANRQTMRRAIKRNAQQHGLTVTYNKGDKVGAATSDIGDNDYVMFLNKQDLTLEIVIHESVHIGHSLYVGQDGYDSFNDYVEQLENMAELVGIVSTTIWEEVA